MVPTLLRDPQTLSNTLTLLEMLELSYCNSSVISS